MIATFENTIRRYDWLLELVLVMAAVVLLILLGPMLRRSLRQWRSLRRGR